MPQIATHTATDTLAKNDTAKIAPKPFVPKYVKGFPDSAGNDRSFNQLKTFHVMEVPQGLPAKVFESSHTLTNGIMMFIIIAFLFISLSFKNGFKYFFYLLHSPFSMRLRENLFEDRTIKETFILSTLIINSSIVQGILLYFILDYNELILSWETNELIPVAICIGISGLYYIFQRIFYNILGYVFGTPECTKIWLEGFNSTQALLGIALIPIVLMINIGAASITTLFIIGIILYILSHILFIFKGFRIFFNKIQLSLYFILYLCTVEIVPVVVSIAVAIYLCNLLQS